MRKKRLTLKRCCTPHIEEWMTPGLREEEVRICKAFKRSLIILSVSLASLIVSVAVLITAVATR